MKPADEVQLAEMLRGAVGPLRIMGGGTRAIGRAVAGEVLETSGLSGISLYEPGALTMVAAAGTPLAQIEAALAAENQRLAFEPPDMRGLLGRVGVSTIGGVVAANASGPRRVQVGACRDHLLGVRFVDGAGTVIKNGGRVMKNVTGYDLVKLLAGSHGTLGVLSEVSFKVLPCPETEATVVIHGQDAARAVQAMSMALGSPFEVSGAAHEAGKTYLRVEGFAASVAYRTGRLGALLAGFGEVTIEADADLSAAIWRRIRDVEGFYDAAVVVRVALKPSDVDKVLVPGHRVMLDWGGGLAWFAGADTKLLQDLQTLCARIGGHATLIKGAVDAPHFQPEPAGIAALTTGLRAKFDPRGILNPDLMV